MDNTVYIIDLDGTLLTCNSFNRFVVWTVSTLGQRHKFADTLRILLIVLGRKLRFYSHRAAKWRILEITKRHFLPLDYREFASYVTNYVRPFFYDLPQDSVKNLATAAPEQYASEIADLLEFNYCIATRMTRTLKSYEETRRVHKKTEVRKLIEHTSSLQGRPLHFYTDHKDDTPLAEYVRKLGGEVTFIK